MRAIDIATGKEQAKAHVDENLSVAPAYSRGLVFLWGLCPGEYLAVRVVDGRVVWHHKEQATGSAIYASAAVTDNSVIFASRSLRCFVSMQKPVGSGGLLMPVRKSIARL